MTHSLLTFLRQLSARLSTKSNEDDEDEDVDDDDEIEEVDDEEADDGDGDEEENGNSYLNLMKVNTLLQLLLDQQKIYHNDEDDDA